MPLTAAQQTILDEERDWRAQRDHARGTALSARTQGMMALVDRGCTVWARTDGNDARVDSHDDPRGGVVLEVTVSTSVDNETGEITRRRAFRCISPYNFERVTLTEAQVNLDGIELVDRNRIHRLISRLAEQLVPTGRARRSLLQDEQRRLDTVADMFRLASACRIDEERPL